MAWYWPFSATIPPKEAAELQAPMDKQQEEEEKPREFETVPFDPRHRNTNQTRHCFQLYVDYHRCKRFLAKEGRDGEYVDDKCGIFERYYKTMCPSAWTTQWDEWVEEGRAPFYLDPPSAWKLDERLAHLEANRERAKSAVSSGHQVRFVDPTTGEPRDISVYEYVVPEGMPTSSMPIEADY